MLRIVLIVLLWLLPTGILLTRWLRCWISRCWDS